MTKHTLIGLSALFLVSCTQVNTSTDKTITQGGDTVGEVDISLSKWDAVEELSKIDEPAVNELLFKASGSEPGWFAEFYTHKLRLVVDYGKDSLLIDDKFDISETKEVFSYSKNTTIGGKNIALAIAINNKPCVSASGDKENRSVSIKLNNKEYTGCGSFVK